MLPMGKIESDTDAILSGSPGWPAFAGHDSFLGGSRETLIPGIIRPMRRFAFLLAASLLPFVAQADESTLLSYWVQVGPGGADEARALVSADACPIIVSFADDKAEHRTDTPMTVRAPAAGGFPMVCAGPMPAEADSAWIATSRGEGDARQLALQRNARSAAWHPRDPEHALPLRRREPERILVLGDTGCRLKGDTVQACNDPLLWPFPTLAKAAAKLRPDLIVDVGDYLYRETPCPAGNAGCAGSPSGENDWGAWKADWFDPAAPLFAAAPVVLVRGNHEGCDRAGLTYLRTMGPYAFDPGAPCAGHQAPFTVPLGPMDLVVMDDADSANDVIDTEIPTYKAEFAALHGPRPIWLAMHCPVWGVVSGPLGLPVGGDAMLIDALGRDGIPPLTELLIAGHIHTFEAINYAAKVPPQIISGTGGDRLDTAPDDLKGTIFTGQSGVTVKDGLSVNGFGFLMMTKLKDRWTIDLYDSDATYERQCVFANGRVDCPQK
jgi:calcineurin-like phosphoesterase family protein